MAHTTKYGNKYTEAEWKAMKIQHKAEAEARDDISAKVEKMLNYLRRQCVEFGFEKDQADAIARLFSDGSFLTEEIKFSSKNNEEFVNDLYSRFDKAMSELN